MREGEQQKREERNYKEGVPLYLCHTATKAGSNRDAIALIEESKQGKKEGRREAGLRGFMRPMTLAIGSTRMYSVVDFWPLMRVGSPEAPGICTKALV